MILKRYLAALGLTLLLGACASTSETNPSRTATEQLLVARAADRAVEGLTLPIPRGTRVFVDDTYFRAENAPYAVSAIRAALSEAGYSLAPSKQEAAAVLELRAGALSLEQMRRMENEAGRYTLVFLAAPADRARSQAERSPEVELTFNWDPETYTGGRNFGHLAYKVEDIYAACQTLMDGGVTINRPPRDGRMAFVRSPDNISIEILQKGDALPSAEPWASMANTGKW